MRISPNANDEVRLRRNGQILRKLGVTDGSASPGDPIDQRRDMQIWRLEHPTSKISPNACDEVRKRRDFQIIGKE
jgi:hypothetical protein